jgi:hypothetical protein
VTHAYFSDNLSKRGVKFLARGKWIAALAAIILWPAPVQANVGDTLPQLRSRYGSAQELGGQMLFEVRLVNGQFVPARDTASTTQDRLTIAVYFDGPNSAMEVFTRDTSDPAKAELSQADVDAILTATGGGQEWHAIQVPTGHATWVTTDKKLIARFSPNKTGKIDDASVLVIMVNNR